MGRKGENSTDYWVDDNWYNIDEKFEDVIKEEYKRKLSTKELGKVLNKFYGNCEYTGKPLDARNVLKKNGSDIISRLKEKVGLELELYATDTDKLKFEKLQLLKQICIAEKFGEKNTLGNREQKIHTYKLGEHPKYRMPLIDIIANPSLSYIGGESDYAKYKPEFDRLVAIIRDYTPNAEAIENTINNIHDDWKRLITSTYYDATVAFSDSQTSNGYVTKEDSIRKTFEYVRRIPVNFQNLIEIPNKQETSLIERFYILLLTTRIRAELRDYHQLCKDDIYNDKGNAEELNPNQEYLDRYFRNSTPSENLRQYFATYPFYNKEVRFYKFEDFIRRGVRDLKDFENNEEKMDVWRLILLNESPCVKDIEEIPDSAYNFASNYTQKMVKMWRSSETGEPAKEQYPVDWWCIVFRELMHIFLKGESIETQQDYYKNKSQVLTAAVKSNADCRAFQNMILTKHFRDRHTLMYSSPKVVEYRQEMEKHILDIEESVMRFQTLEEIVEANRIMSFVVFLNFLSEERLIFADLLLHLNTNDFDTKYNIYFNDDKAEHHFISALISDITFRNKNLSKNKTAVSLISKIFTLCIRNKSVYDEHKDCFYRVPICFQEKDDYKMRYTFKVDHIAKIITVTSCTFDDDIQKILDT
ncbi:MAG: hypothetical protein NC548_36485 [Lachnospiraceae bacterium]|nr:hypothetical protein [Lachnospiraceae bacterium]MCM1230389.1 hypothetical protein [Ruminococcus flavefaciens]